MSRASRTTLVLRSPEKAHPTIDVSRLVFVDGTWAKDNMVRPYDRSPRGQRLLDKVPPARRQTTTFVKYLRQGAMAKS